MVSTSPALEPRHGHSKPAGIHTFLLGFVDLLRSVSRSLAIRREYEHLSRLPDGQLARLGLSRQTLPQQLFAKHFKP